jgi:hypothetical protein
MPQFEAGGAGRWPRIVVAVLLIQLFAFLTFVEREVSWTHTFSFDQAAYLLRAYSDFETLLTRGIGAAVWEGVTAPVAGGALLTTEAALLFALFGAGRKTALLLHLLHWLAFLWLSYRAGRKVGGREEWGAAAMGLALAALAPMAMTGGLFDFRLDGSAMSLVGIVAALAVLSDGLEDRRYTLWFAAAAAYAIGVRHILLVFLAGGLAFYAVALVAMRARGMDVGARWRNLLLAGGWIGGFTALVVAAKFDVLYRYYWVGHVAGAEKEVRSAVYGGSVWYYLESFGRDHLGWVAAVLAGVFLAWHVAMGKREEEGTARFPALLIGGIAAAAYGALTMDASKSPVVGSVFLGPAIMGVLLVARAFGGPARAGGIVCAGILALGGLVNFGRYAQHSPLWELRGAIDEVARAQKVVGDYVAAMPGRRAVLFIDRNTDYQNAASLITGYYEQSGRMIRLDDPVGGNVTLSDWTRYREHLLAAHVALVTEVAPEGRTDDLYPTTKMFAAHTEEILGIVRGEMARAGEINLAGHRVGVYLRPQVKLEGDSGGWLTSAGATLRVPRQWLRGKRGLVLEGRTLHAEQLKGPLGGKAVVKESGQELPVYVSPVTPDYRIEIDTGAVATGGEGDVAVELTFDRYWVPQEAGVSPDSRKLVISTPREVRLLGAPKLVWK